MKKLYILTKDKLDAIVAEKVTVALAEENNDLEKELLLKQANLAALQEQINPHFLYNALECIRGQALVENATAVASATHALSQYFRYCISNKSGIVTLANELAYVRDYVTIQQFRFQGRFVLDCQIEDDRVLDAVVPKLILQPLVENAIIHGLADKTEGGIIKIAVQRTQKHLQISVSDNGRGIPAEKLRELNEGINMPYTRNRTPEKGGTGIALGNVNNRLKMLFGDGYGLTMYSGGPNNGAVSTIFIPCTHSVKL